MCPERASRVHCAGSQCTTRTSRTPVVGAGPVAVAVVATALIGRIIFRLAFQSAPRDSGGVMSPYAVLLFVLVYVRPLPVAQVCIPFKFFSRLKRVGTNSSRLTVF